MQDLGMGSLWDILLNIDFYYMARFDIALSGK